MKNLFIPRGAAARRVGPLAKLTCSLLALDVATPVLAADALPRFQMQAALDAPGGAQLQRGDYAAAIARVAGGGSALAGAATWRATNSCVAHTMERQLTAALVACDVAIERATVRANVLDTERARRDRVALMYSNRAVAHWRAGNSAAAESELAAAASFSPKLPVVKANIEALNARRQTL
jgi:hypothetical protein